MPTVAINFSTTEQALSFIDKIRASWDREQRSIASAPPAPQAIPPELDVRTLLLSIEPGADGMGEEVYAKSVADVEAKLTALDKELEEWQLGIKRLPCLLESVVGDYVADGKQAIDEAIDAAMKGQQ